MVRLARPITREQFEAACDVENSFLDHGETLDDWLVEKFTNDPVGSRFCRSTFLGRPCHFVQTHGFEYVFQANALTESEETLKDGLEQLKQQHPNLMVHAWPSNGGIHLDTIMAKTDAPPGSGSRYMADLCEFADQQGLLITLQTATKETVLYSNRREGQFKRTTSTNRLKNWYRRFGFLPNSRYGRFDLRGNMFRLPIKR